MSWSREQVSILVDEYKKHPCLYAVKSKDYKNKHSRMRALEAIETVLQLVKPNVTVNDIKAKFHGLKTNFLTEHRKHEQSIKTGTGEDDIYQPTIWYYELMFFVLEHCTPRSATDSISSCHEAMPSTPSTTSEVMVDDLEDTLECEFVDDAQYEDSELEIVNFDVQPDNSLKPAASTSNGRSLVPIRKRKRTDTDKVMEEATGALRLMSNVLNKKVKTNSKNRYNIFGEFVASKLQQIHPDIVDEVEAQIINVLLAAIRDSKDK